MKTFILHSITKHRYNNYFVLNFHYIWPLPWHHLPNKRNQKKSISIYIYIIHILQTPATISIFPPQFLLHFNKPSDFTAASVSLRPNLWRPKASTAPAKAAASAATGFAKSGASAANSRRCWSRHGVLSSTSTPSSKRRSVESLSWIFGSFFLFLGGKSFQFPVDSKTMPTNRYTAIRIMLAVRPQIVCPCVLS